ncbi:hypothetical protein N9L68_01050 [bacterium]|nr:hypothetical protein [bacterium]
MLAASPFLPPFPPHTHKCALSIGWLVAPSDRRSPNNRTYNTYVQRRGSNSLASYGETSRSSGCFIRESSFTYGLSWLRTLLVSTTFRVVGDCR